MQQIVFISGPGDIRIGIAVMKRGALDFLPKPLRTTNCSAPWAQALARSAEKEIGTELGVTLRTIKAHRTRIVKKIGVISVVELVRLAEEGACRARTSRHSH
jgi:FixJ family two-component response regulator